LLLQEQTQPANAELTRTRSNTDSLLHESCSTTDLCQFNEKARRCVELW